MFSKWGVQLSILTSGEVDILLEQIDDVYQTLNNIPMTRFLNAY
ncbi:MAG: hypothetical protein ACJA2E_001322 [Arenicella sp.]|jgi:hypothetical protein